MKKLTAPALAALFRPFRVGFLLVVGLLLVLAPGCVETEAKPRTGEVVVALQGDMSFPEDLDELRLFATLDGEQVVDDTYEIAPQGTTQLPRTLRVGLGRAPGTALSVRLVGLADGEPRLIAKAETTVPEDRIALLQLSLQWLCREELGAGDPAELEGRCEDGRTCSAGACVSSAIREARLPDYAAEDVFGGAELDDPLGRCFATAECLDVGTDVVPDAECRVAWTLPEGATANFGLVMAPGEGGIAGERGRYIALDRGPTGWQLLSGEDAGADTPLRVQLPPAVCDELTAGTIRAVRASAACPTKVASMPTCGPWSVIDGAVFVAVLENRPAADASAPIADAAAPATATPNDASVPTDDASVPTVDAGAMLRITLASGEDVVPVSIGVTLPLRVDGLDPEEATWFSDNEAVATVSSDGLVTTHGPGTAVITVEHDGQYGEVKIIVAGGGLGATLTATLSELRIVAEVTAFEFDAVGEVAALTAFGTYTNGAERDVTALVAWESSVASVAAFDEDGALVLVGSGTTEISASLDGISDSVAITVGPNETASAAGASSGGAGASVAGASTGGAGAGSAGAATGGAGASSAGASTGEAGAATGGAGAGSAGAGSAGASTGEAGAASAGAATGGAGAGSAGAAAIDDLVVLTYQSEGGGLEPVRQGDYPAYFLYDRTNDVDVTYGAEWSIVGGTFSGLDGPAYFHITDAAATITAVYLGQEVTVELDVLPIASLAILQRTGNSGQELVPMPQTAVSGSQVSPIALAYYADASSLDLTYDVTWIYTNVSGNSPTSVVFDTLGTVSIAATYGGHEDSVSITVTAAADALDVLAFGQMPLEELAQPYVGDVVDVVVYARLGEDTEDVTQQAPWVSSGASVSLVESQTLVARITFDAPGTAVVAVTWGGLERRFEFVVTERPQPIRLTVTPVQTTVEPGGAATFVATLDFSDESSLDVTSGPFTTWDEASPLGDDGPGYVTVPRDATPGDYPVQVTFFSGTVQFVQTVTVTVPEPPQPTLEIVPTGLDTIAVDETTLWGLQLRQGNTVTPVDPWDGRVEWDYDDEGLFFDDGEFTGLETGTYPVSVRYVDAEVNLDLADTRTLEVTPLWVFVPEIATLTAGQRTFFHVEVTLKTGGDPVIFYSDNLNGVGDGTFVDYAEPDGPAVSGLLPGEGSVTFEASIGQIAYTYKKPITVKPVDSASTLGRSDQ